MTRELETVAAGVLSGFFRRKPTHALPLGTPCPNCATPLQGPWCHACGQLGEDFHRSTWRLVKEAFEGLLHFDGRVWRTLPDLFLNPGRLTRAYLEGHRAPQIPPLRLFLVVLLAVFLAGSIGGARFWMIHVDAGDTPQGQRAPSAPEGKRLSELTPAERAHVAAAIDQGKVQIGGVRNTVIDRWAHERLKAALADPERFSLILEQWSERFAFLMLPLAAGLLSLLFVFQRRFFLFDHTIFALHSLSVAGLVLSVVFLLNPVSRNGASVLLLALPVHLFVHMRAVYETSVIGALVRMALLFFGSLVGFGLILVGLLTVGLNGMAGA